MIRLYNPTIVTNIKTCNNCGLNKTIDQFIKNRNQCKDCNKLYYQNNKEQIKNNQKIYRDSIDRSDYKKEYYKSHKEQIKQYQLNNKEIIQTYYNKEHKSNYYQNNKEHIKQTCSNYRKSDKSKLKRKLRYHNRKQSDPSFNIKIIYRNRIRMAVKSQQTTKAYHTMDLIGCSIDFLKDHLQQTAIKNGYTNFNINNYSGKDYHIDHIIPCSAFNLKCSYHQMLCFNWSNMQILSATDNLMKNNKVIL